MENLAKDVVFTDIQIIEKLKEMKLKLPLEEEEWEEVEVVLSIDESIFVDVNKCKNSMFYEKYEPGYTAYVYHTEVDPHNKGCRTTITKKQIGEFILK